MNLFRESHIVIGRRPIWRKLTGFGCLVLAYFGIVALLLIVQAVRG